MNRISDTANTEPLPLARSLELHYLARHDMNQLLADVSKISPKGAGNKLSASQLGSLDQFHVRGLVATAELARLLGLTRSDVVLDAGAGLGGPARFLAETYGCQVVGVDISPSFVALASSLSQLTAVSHRVNFCRGDITELPFAPQSFTAVWTQHTLMNVPCRELALREFARVLKRGGKLALNDILLASEFELPIYPVPWAEDASMSFLQTQEETRSQLTAAGFVEEVWVDTTALAQNWFAQAQPVPQQVSLRTVLGEGFHARASNLATNLRDGKLKVVMAVYRLESKRVQDI